MTVNDATLAALHRRARQAGRHVLLTEGEEPRAILAASRAVRRGIARVTLLGDPKRIRAEAHRLAEAQDGVAIQSVAEEGRALGELVRVYAERWGARGLGEDEARRHLQDPLLWGALQVHSGRYDGLVAGGMGLTPRVLRGLLRGIGMAPGVRRVSSFMLVTTAEAGSGGTLALADCAVNAEPSAQDLAEIALLAARNARPFLAEPPRVALLSFSTEGSADHPRTRKVAEAARIVKARAPGLIADGGLQVDAALVPEVAARKAPKSAVGGRANVLVFPDLESADIACRLLEALGAARTLGPILQGLARPANVAAPGCEADDLVDLIAVTAEQAVMSGPEQVGPARAEG